MKVSRLQYLVIFTTGLLLLLPEVTFAQSFLDNLNEAAQNLVFKIVMGILGMFVWLAALLLNFSVNNFIIGFGNTFANTGVGVAVDNVWVIVRDFVNLTFIFGFVYIGFKMILNSSDSNTRRWLVNIILAALLVNFSLFVVKFAIDMSNQLAAQIAVNGLASTCTGDSCRTAEGLAQVDIASEFMARMGLSKVYSLDVDDINGAGWGYIFGSAMLSLTAMFVFAAGGLLIIIRFAILCLFMVMSPVMFLSWILPPMKDTFERFWSMFIGRALFAPIYLLFIYFSLQIISGLQVSIGGNSNGFGSPDWAGTFQGARTVENGAAVGQLGTFPFFILACIFMAASVVVANKLGADGGAKAVGLGKAFGNKVRGYTGRVATKPGRMAAGGATRLAGAGAANLEGRLNRRLGTLAQGGAWSQRAARVLDRSAGDRLRNAQNATAFGGESYNARNTRVGQQQTRFNQQAQEAERQARVIAERNNHANADESTEAGRMARRDASNAIGGQVRRMSDTEILAMISGNPALLQSPEFVQHLTDGHMTAIRNSGTLTNAQHAALGDLRNDAAINETTAAFDDAAATADELNTAFEELGQTVRNMSAERKAGLGAARLSREDVAMHLSDRDIEQLEQSGRFNATEIRNIRTSRENAQINLANGTLNLGGGRTFAAAGTPQGNAFVGRQRGSMMSDPRQAGNLPAAVFANHEMAEHITPQALEQRIRNGLNDAEADAIRTSLERHISGLAAGDPAKRVWEDWDNRSVNAGRIDLDPRIF